MALRVPNLGTGNGSTGDNELKIRQDYNHNFEDQSNAASRLVGTTNGQIPLAEQIPSLLGTAATKNVGTGDGNVLMTGAYGLGSISSAPKANAQDYRGNGFVANTPATLYGLSNYSLGYQLNGANEWQVYLMTGVTDGSVHVGYRSGSTFNITWLKLLSTGNTMQDPNGFLKGASPIAEIYSDKIELNQDALSQGGVTFEKLTVGDYLVKGSLGFAQEGWYIETPKDANGNVLVAVVYEQLANNDISIKTYAKKFDDETGDIVANLLKPRDIPAGRFISLRLHELPKESPVMPTELQPEV